MASNSKECEKKKNKKQNKTKQNKKSTPKFRVLVIACSGAYVLDLGHSTPQPPIM
jgi:hypothetical protein